MKKLLDFNPQNGVAHTFHYDDTTNEARITATQDTDALTDLNKIQYNETATRWGDGQKVASIPMVTYFELKKAGILDDQEAMKKWLNDPDNRFFRTRPGRI